MVKAQSLQWPVNDVNIGSAAWRPEMQWLSAENILRISWPRLEQTIEESGLK
jgi:hypothetical protein